MRIAVVSPRLPTPALPMRGVVHDEQMHGFSRAGHDVQGIVPVMWSLRRRLNGTRVPDTERDRDIIVTHPRYPRLPTALRGGALERSLFVRAAGGALASWAARAPIDIMLLHSALLPGGLIGKRGATTYVVSIYDHEIYDLAPASTRTGRMIAATLCNADCAVYLSEALRREAVALAGPHRSVVIPLGIDVFAGISLEPPAHFTICTVARLIARKRVDRLIVAFARLSKERPDARLVIVGDGSERGRLEGLVARLGLRAQVQFAGALDARATRVQMARASVMALPSVRESLGAVYLEAMSLGVPVLGTKGEGIEEHIRHGENGVLVPPDDGEALLGQLRALAAEPARASHIGAEGKRYVSRGTFSWEANMRAFLELFQELAGARRVKK